MTRIPFHLAPVAPFFLVLAFALSGATGCKKAAEGDVAADSAFQAEQQKALDARTAAEQECDSLPGAAKEDCRSVAGAEYERMVSEARERREKTGP